ncbi:MAG: DUF268 domain-containing protein [Promethearchaeota archaeon]
MKKSSRKTISLAVLLKQIQSQVLNWKKLRNIIPKLLEYYNQWKLYSSMEGAEPSEYTEAAPKIYDKTLSTKFDSHYFYQNIWGYNRILESKCKNHVDIGSDIVFVGLLSAITEVTFIDIRPLRVNLRNFKSKKGNILSLPYENNSIYSLSSLHVAEHIGLGRYGDALDPLGTKKATKELSRILAPNGNLYFSLPIGKPRLCFNAHRIHSTQQILEYFSDLKLLELSGIDDKTNFIENIDRNILDSCNYGCGLFWFTKD